MIKRIITIVITAVLLCSMPLAVPFEASTADEAVISEQDENYVPLYTVKPDASENFEQSSYVSIRDYRIFYAQTTFLALLAGYLILFKVKGINHDEKMHRRSNTKLK